MTEGHEKKADLKDLRKEDFKLATSVFLSTILAAVLNFIIYMSFTMIFLGLSTKTIGERIYEREKDGSTKLITEIYYDATTTAARTEATAAGTSLQTQKPTETAAGGTESSATGTAAASSTSGTSTADTKSTLAENQFVESIRTEMPKTVSVAMGILSQSFMFVLFAALIYSKLWERGDRDANSVNFGRMEEDKLRGLRIGLIAAVPSIVFYLLLVVSKLGLITEKYFFIYRFLNLTFMPVMSALTGKAGLVSTNVSWLSLAAILLTVATLPLISHAAYLLGYNHISLSEKIIYVNPDKKRKRRRY